MTIVLNLYSTILLDINHIQLSEHNALWRNLAVKEDAPQADSSFTTNARQCIDKADSPESNSCLLPGRFRDENK